VNVGGRDKLVMWLPSTGRPHGVAPTENAMDLHCPFCQIVTGSVEAPVVYQDDVSVAFLDRRPLFPGHTLLVPRRHFETLIDLPPALIAPFFSNAQLLTLAVQEACGSEGTFVAVNNRVSQSVPHLHLHIVPRRKKDGLKGFFWPRKAYGEGEAAQMQKKILQALLNIMQEGGEA
jgi:histidine triad (HIT) family protein